MCWKLLEPVGIAGHTHREGECHKDKQLLPGRRESLGLVPGWSHEELAQEQL
jgi:hypothetical protein